MLVQRLLAFARRQPLQPVAVDIARLVEEHGGPRVEHDGAADRGRGRRGSDLPPAMADPNQLEMAILNLAVNARDAMPDGRHAADRASADTAAAGSRRQAPTGRYVCLSVADTGTGMDEATLARAVEPFFSTKGIGKGTGLGLSMVHGLASQLGGALTIKSKLGLGTTVELWLPQTEAVPEAPALTRDAEPVQGTRHGAAGGRRGTGAPEHGRHAGDLGYRVVEANSAEEALRVTERRAADPVVTDHLMPGMSGTDLARALRDQSRAPSSWSSQAMPTSKASRRICRG